MGVLLMYFVNYLRLRRIFFFSFFSLFFFFQISLQFRSSKNCVISLCSVPRIKLSSFHAGLNGQFPFKAFTALTSIFIHRKVKNSINLEPDLRNPLEDVFPLCSRSKEKHAGEVSLTCQVQISGVSNSFP